MFDPIAIFQERWFLVIGLAVVLIFYLLTMDFRLFLATVPLVMVMQLLLETISVAIFFPYSSIHYISPPELEFYMVLIPFSSVAIKSFVYLTSSYLVASAVGKKYLVNKVDMVSGPRKKIGETIYVAFFASILSTVAMMIVEPVLVNSMAYGFGPYEEFTTYGIYYGVNPTYFAGWLISSISIFALVATGESSIELKLEKVLFEFEERAQKAGKHQLFGFIVFILGILIPSFLSIYIDLTLFIIDFFVLIPVIILLMYWFSKWSSKMDEKFLDRYCNDHEDSMLCDKLK